jgi:hypothetical protein
MVDEALNAPTMSNNQRTKKSNLRYSRNKGKVEIDGDPSDVKWLAWADLCSSRLIKIILLVIGVLGMYKMQIFAWLMRLL